MDLSNYNNIIFINKKKKNYITWIFTVPNNSEILVFILKII